MIKCIFWSDFEPDIHIVVYFFQILNLNLFSFYLVNFLQVLVADINIGYEDIVNTQV